MKSRSCAITLAVLLSTTLFGGSALARATKGSSKVSPVIGLVKGSAWGYEDAIKQGSISETNGPLSLAETGCDGGSFTQVATLGSVKYQSYARTGSITGEVKSVKSTGSLTLISTATVHNLSLAGGIVTATLMSAQSMSVGMPTTATSANSARFVGLNVAGVKIGSNVAPNTRLSLPGLGYVILNEQSGRLKAHNYTWAAVNLVDVYITAKNSYGILPGSRIVIGHSNSSFSRTVAAYLVHGNAFGYEVQGHASSANSSSGRAAYVQIGCTGGEQSNRMSQLQSDVATSGTMVDHTKGGITTAGSMTQSSSVIQNVSLLGGIIKAKAINVSAESSTTKSGSTHNASTVLTDATILGLPVKDSPSPNTRLGLPGIGYVVINQQSVNRSNGLAQGANGIHVFITNKNALGLPVGAQIVVAHAKAASGQA